MADKSANQVAVSKGAENDGKEASEGENLVASSLSEEKCGDWEDQRAKSGQLGRSSQRKYTRERLLAFKDKPELRKPPSGFNPALLKPFNEGAGHEGRGPGWRGKEGWHPPAALGKGQIHSRLVDDGTMDPPQNAQDQPGDGKWLTTRSGWRGEGGYPQGAPRRSRSEQPGRWDANKAAEEGRSGANGAGNQQKHSGLERRWSEFSSKGERWGSYGHREKPQYRNGNEGSNRQEPEWMHDVSDDTEKTTGISQKDRAAMFEEQRKKYKESWSKQGGPSQNIGQGQLDNQLMTDEEIEKMMHGSDDTPSTCPTPFSAAQPGGGSNMATFSFDSLKEAFKQAGVADLPPLPPTFSTVDEIEKGMQAGRMQRGIPGLPGFGTGGVPPGAGVPRVQMPPMPSQYKSVGELEREQYGINAAGTVGLGGASHQAGGGPVDGSNFLLSLLKGAASSQVVQPGMPAVPGNSVLSELQTQTRVGIGLPWGAQGNGNLAGLVGAPAARQDSILGRLFAAAAQKNAPSSTGVLPNLLLHQQGMQIGAGQVQPQPAGLPLLSGIQQTPYVRGMPQQGNPMVNPNSGLILGQDNLELGGAFPGNLIRPSGVPGLVRPPGAVLAAMDNARMPQNQFWGQAQFAGTSAGHQDPPLVHPNILAQLQGMQHPQSGQQGLERFFNLNAVGGMQPRNMQAKPVPTQHQHGGA